jgi:hypothetical protein
MDFLFSMKSIFLIYLYLTSNEIIEQKMIKKDI